MSNLLVILSTHGNGVKDFLSDLTMAALPELLELDLAWLKLFQLQLILLQRNIYVMTWNKSLVG